MSFPEEIYWKMHVFACFLFEKYFFFCIFSVISEEDQEQIREFLMANDFLYNKSRDQWRDTPARDKKWEELGELLGCDARDMKQWYQSTRSKLSDIKNKKVTPSGSGFDVEGMNE